MMFDNRKIKKAIRKHIKPAKPFRVFCSENGLDKRSEIIQENTKVKVRAVSALVLCVSILVCIVMLVIIYLLPTDKVAPSPSPQIKFYGAEEVYDTKITIEEIRAFEVPLLLNFSKIEQLGAIYKTMSKDGDLLLGLQIRDLLYGFMQDEILYAFDMSITIRCYKGYLFTTLSLYENPDYKYDEKCAYNISENGIEAYITVTNQDYEYFITVKEYENITPITRENIDLLISDILEV